MTVSKADKASTSKLQFHYIKGPTYREAACHGAIGGVTPQNKVWMALFSERGPIPRIVEFDVAAPEGADRIQFNESQATPSHVEGRAGIIRHIEIGAYLDLDVAVRLRDWLDQRIVELKKQKGRRKAKKKQ